MTSDSTMKEQLSYKLYQLDPMHTCCAENECVDEYDRVAAGIVSRLTDGESAGAAINGEFDDWFGMVPNDEMLTAITQFLSSLSDSRNNA